MNFQYIPPPIIVPVHHSDNGSWRAHAMHCPDCKKIYDRENEVGAYIIITIVVVCIVAVIVSIRSM